MVQICALASGSNGNCYYVGNGNEAIIVDMGITNRQLTNRLKTSGLSMQKIKAVFISHEHGDHIQGLRQASKKNDFEVYITKKTHQNARMDHRSQKVNYFDAGDTIAVGNICIHSFSKPHDAIDPVSFRIETEGVNVGVLTDLGTITPLVASHIKQCNAAFIETNYEHDLLLNGKYPAFLKQRVASDYGHLSNLQAYEFVASLTESPLKTVLLAHISADNNRIDLAMNHFNPLAHKMQIVPTSRYAASKVIEL